MIGRSALLPHHSERGKLYMISKKFKRMAAALAACSVMASAMPQIPSVSYAAENLISNSTFEDGTDDWGTYLETGGECELSTSEGRLALTISDVGKKNYSVQVFYDIVPLFKNGRYHLKFDISSTIDRRIEAILQQNGGKYTSYKWLGLDLEEEPQTVDCEFTMEYDTDIMSKFVFNCGIQTEYEGRLPEHTIYIDNVSLELLNPDEVDTTSFLPKENDININQVGYRTNVPKTAVFRHVTDQKEFSVINADTNEAVYTGKLVSQGNNKSAGEDNWTGDFSSVHKVGKYYISCEGLEDSYPFEISDSVYSNLLDDSIRMLYLQRCGTKVEDKDFGHVACHTSKATILGTSEKIDVSGGWHDAGDYGRYTVAASKAVADLLYSYISAPDFHSDSIGIPESGNNVPDILDETRYELEWMLKMQRDDGGVYHKVTCEKFPGYIMPEKETEPLIVTPVSSTATADFCASMALAAEAYRKYDKDFADTCLAAAKKSWDYLQKHPEFDFENPSSVKTGDYGDKTDKDERYWAAAQMYRATKNDTYLDALSEMATKTGLDWSTVGDYGNIAILTMENIDTGSSIYNKCQNAVLEQAEEMLMNTYDCPYGTSITEYNWGSNMTIANSGNILMLAYNLTGETKYRDAANKQLDYLLGVNPLGTSFVSGYGTVSPEHPHHRPSMCKYKAMKGMLAGGVNQNLEDSAAKAYCKTQPPAKCFIDNAESYSTNEITIYWNSPLTYLLTNTDPSVYGGELVIDPTEPSTGNDGIVWGDANCDGEIDMSDVVIVMQSSLNPKKYGVDGTSEDHITPDGIINGNVDNVEGTNANDALLIQKYVLKIIPQLPVNKTAAETK